MLAHPVTLYWHRADQLCFVVPPSSWVTCKKRPSLVWLDPAATGNRTQKSSWSVLGPPYRGTLYWHRADQLCFVVPPSSGVPCKKRPLPFLNVFGMTGPSSNRESSPQILLVSAGSPLSLPFTISRGYWGPIPYQGAPSGAPTPDPHGVHPPPYPGFLP